MKTERSKEIHANLVKYYRELRGLDDPRVDRLLMFGYSAINFSGVYIQKTSEPIETSRDNVNFNEHDGFISNPTNLITIGEFQPIGINDVSYESDNYARQPEDLIVKVTDYTVSSLGEYSEPEQYINIYSPYESDKVSHINNLARIAINLTNKYIELESNDGSDLDLTNCEYQLAGTYRNIFQYLEEEKIFQTSMGSYSSTEHQRLLRKIGSLVFY